MLARKLQEHIKFIFFSLKAEFISDEQGLREGFVE